MRRLVVLAIAAWLTLALTLAPAVALADDPRCADWEQHGAPPGIDLKLVCTADQVIGAYTGRSDGGVTSERAFPYIVALFVTGIGLVVVGVVAMRLVGGTAGRRLAPEKPDAFWVCPSCQSLNPDGRSQCYACQASRSSAGGQEVPALVHREPEPDSEA